MRNFSNRQFLGSELLAEENDPMTARIQVIPCPMEKTVSYGSGTSLGPDAILEASQELERSSICSAGIYTQEKVDCSGSHEECLQELKERVAAVVKTGGVPVTLGGEHSLTWGAVSGLSEALGAKVGILQVDAHADLRLGYQGKKHSHASVMRLLVEEGHALASLGVRAICQEEREQRQKRLVVCHDGEDLIRGKVFSLELPPEFPELIYLSFDLDALDPSIMPAVGTPVPGGLGYYQAIDLVESCLQGRSCVGMDLVELAPSPGGDHVSSFTAACLLQRLLEIILKTG